ncbi:MAG: cyclic nucleotide-binding domain-containing protein, partial [Cyanobacteria bacterium J06576_12]
MEARSLDTSELIQMTPFFAELSPEAAQQAAAQVVTRRHPANQVILLENDWGNSVYFILEGWVKIRTYNLDGKDFAFAQNIERDLF